MLKYFIAEQCECWAEAARLHLVNFAREEDAFSRKKEREKLVY
jgi:hypothetical protein